jgi:tRNA-specific 2-thiouridylase
LFRFPKLTELAQALGAARVATGHYARIAAKDGKPIIARGADPSKDQSYMLWAVAAPLLSKLDFPLGGLTKKETRRLAREASLPTHGCAESQEVCFIPDNDYRRFLRTRTTRPVHDGEIVDKNGKRLGSHRGYMDFTVGQRRGLGISAPQPLYVLETIPAKNQVIAGVRDELAVRRIEITGINSFGRYRDDKLVDNELNLQVRYNSAAAPARVAERSEAGWTVELNKPVYGVAPGQSAVLYAGDVIVAGGVIASTGQ